MQRRNKDQRYPEITTIAKKMRTVIIAFCTLSGIVCLLSVLIFLAINKSNEIDNKKATEFNSLSISERKVVTEFIGQEGISSKNDGYLMEIKPIYNPYSFANYVAYVMFISLIIALLITTPINYVKACRKEKYFLADFSFWQPSAWFVFFGCLLIWPAFIVSYFHLRQFDDKLTELEQLRVREVAAAELEREFQSERNECFTVKNQQAFINFRIKDYARALSQEVEKTKQDIKNTKHRLGSLGQQIQSAQKSLNQLNAKLDKLTKADFDVQETREIAEYEWSSIIAMRGVQKVYLTKQDVDRKSKRKQKTKPSAELNIIVAVRSIYANELYDFGDFHIKIMPHDFSVRCIREGIKADATSRAPVYRRGENNFCFGSRSSEIEEYFYKNQLVEMLSIIIDSLHYVNDFDKSYIPNCFRKVSAIELQKAQIKQRRRKK